MNYSATMYRDIKETLADDIYVGWVLAAEDTTENDSINVSEAADLHELANQAAVTAIGFVGALFYEMAQHSKNESVGQS